MQVNGPAPLLFKETQEKSQPVNFSTSPSFMESISSSLKLQVAGGNQSASPQLSFKKEEFIEPFSFTQAEEEAAEEYIGRIQKLLREFGDRK